MTSTVRLSRGTLRQALRAAIRRWVKAGVKPRALRRIKIRIADLGGTQLAVTSGRRITIDLDAAGWGWHMGVSRRGLTDERIDLLSVLVHELGHVLGLEHAETGGGVMGTQLAPGMRVLPDRNTVRQLPRKVRRATK